MARLRRHAAAAGGSFVPAGNPFAISASRRFIHWWTRRLCGESRRPGSLEEPRQSVFSRYHFTEIRPTRKSYFRTINVRGKAVAAVCAAPPFSREALDFLTASLERAIEVFGLKLRSPIPRAAVSEKTGAPSVARRPSGRLERRRSAGLTPTLAAPRDFWFRRSSCITNRSLQDGRRAWRHLPAICRKKSIWAARLIRTASLDAVLASHDYFHEELVRILGEQRCFPFRSQRIPARSIPNQNV